MFSLNLVAVFILSFFAASAFATIDKFQEAAPGIYRGAQPQNAEDYQQLKKLGVKTLIDLRLVSENDGEDQVAQTFGFVFHRFPMNAMSYPSDSEVNQILETINKPANQPVFVHCRVGKDRTGLIMALERVLYMKWQPADAYQEAVAFGYNRLFVGMDYYFYKRTGFTDGF